MKLKFLQELKNSCEESEENDDNLHWPERSFYLSNGLHEPYHP